jgi:hypothetical protein
MRVFDASPYCVMSLYLSEDSHWAVSASLDNKVRLWELDWEFEPRQPEDWDEDARHHLINFLRVHALHSHLIPNGQESTQERAFVTTGQSKPLYSEADFTKLLHTLCCAGYGWLKAGGVRRKLKSIANSWPDTDSREFL